MTSKISFSNLVKRTIREQSSLIFASFIYLIVGIMETVFELQRVVSIGYDEITGRPAYDYIPDIFQPGRSMTALLFTIALASSFAFAALRHLHSKSQSDFYGALPIKRRTHLTVLLTSSLLIFVIPLLLQYLVDMIAVAMTGYLSFTVLKYIAFSFMYQILVFLLTWFTAALAMILTGHILTGLLGLAVFCGYAPVVLKYLLPIYADTYFTTYTDVFSSTETGFYAVLDFLSPVSIAARLLNYMDTNGKALWNAPLAVIVLFELAVLAAFVYFLYEKRPAEAAGSSMAFPKWNTFWALLFIVPAALYTGIVFSGIAYGSFAKMWILPGVIIGVIIFAVLIEFLFDFDIKAVLHHKRRFGACFVICMAFLAVFQFDLFGFDRWTPKKEQLESISFNYNGMSFANSDSIALYFGCIPLRDAIAERKGISGDDLDDAYDLAMSYAACGNKYDQGLEIADYIDDEGSHYQTMTVRYRMKNGQEKARAYLVPVNADDPLLQKVFGKESFKDDLYIHYSLTPDMITKAEWYNGFEFEALNFSEEEKGKFLEAYKKDLNNLKLEEVLAENPVSTVRLSVADSDVYDSFIYRSFKNTENFLKDYQISATSYSFTEENTTKLVIHGYEDTEQGNNQEIRKTITDKAQILKLLPYLVNVDLCTVNFAADSMINYNYDVEVYTQKEIVYTQITYQGVRLLDTF